MDHPIRSKDSKELRARMVHLLSNGFMVLRQSNIVFVCGGNSDNGMRRTFQREFQQLLPEFEFFEPEFAMKSYFSLGVEEQFDIADFEEIVAELSHVIVLFPEGPGSYAETGYFSAVNSIAKKTLLVVDASEQSNDSFLSLGPAKKIQSQSEYHPNIQMDYGRPNFQLISDRIRQRKPLSTTKKTLQIALFSDLTQYELFCLLDQIVSYLGIATVDDIEFLMKSIFKNRVNKNRIRKMISILRGSKRLIEVGDFGHLTTSTNVNVLMEVKDGFKTSADVLNIDLSSLALSQDDEFKEVYEDAQ